MYRLLGGALLALSLAFGCAAQPKKTTLSPEGSSLEAEVLQLTCRQGLHPTGDPLVDPPDTSREAKACRALALQGQPQAHN